MSDRIYHERQAAACCGRHAVNNLLQGPLFSDVELAEIAQSLDQRELGLLSANGADARALRAAGSNNVDDSGNFSVDTLREALVQRGLSLSGDKADVEAAIRGASDAFLLNQGAHWISLRRFGGVMLNLNSLLAKPEIVGDFYLGAFLSQLRSDGYQVFVVAGVLPPPATYLYTEPNSWHRLTDLEAGGSSARGRDAAAARKAAAARAAAEAREDPDFAAALSASMVGMDDDGGGAAFGGGGAARGGAGTSVAAREEEEMRRAIAASLGAASSKTSGASANNGASNGAVIVVDDDEDMATLEAAVALSLAPSDADVAARVCTLRGILAAAEPPADGSVPCARIALRGCTACTPWRAMPEGASAPKGAASLTLQRRFPVSAPLAEVFAWAEMCWITSHFPGIGDAPASAAAAAAATGGAGQTLPFSLTLSFPTTVLLSTDASMGSATVSSAGLAPSASLTLRVA